MDLTFLKAKLHHANVTHSEISYEGSCAIDGALLDVADIHEYEQIQIYNLNNGERFTTYAIRAEDQSRIISVNGAAAHKAEPGDKLIICAYASINARDAENFRPNLVYLDENNLVLRTRDSIPVQVA